MRILGIDLGSSNLKAVEMDSAFGRYDIHDYHEHPLETGISPQDAVAHLINNLAKPPDRIVMALPTGQTTLRNLQLPTRDRKAIQAGIGFELEDELPFSSEESLFDYSIISQSKQGTFVHIAATLKSHITKAVESWRNANPDVVTTEAWAYRTFLNRVLGSAEGAQDIPVLLIQMGHQRTTFYIHWKGAPSVIREIDWGGRNLTFALSQKYNIPLDQAETAKIDRGFVSSADRETKEVTEEQLELSSCLEAALEPLIPEIRQMALICKSVTHQGIGVVYLSGGGSLLPGLGSWIEERLQIQTKPLLALSSATVSGVTYSDQTDARFLLAVSLTLTLVGSDRASCINFRKGAFSKEGKSRELNLKVLRKPLIALGITSFCLFLSLVIQSAVYRSRLVDTDVQLQKSVRSFFGQVSSSALKTYLSNTSTLRTSINKELNKHRELSKLFGPNPRSPLDFLNGISSTIPKSIVVDLTQIQIGSAPTSTFVSNDQNANASLTFLVQNPQVAEKLTAMVEKKLNGAQRGKMEEVDGPLGKKWKITFSGKPTEDAYGR